jgi:hypothetical protein
MARNEKKRQQRLAKKKKKRSLRKKAINSALNVSTNASSYSKHPIHECLIPSNIFESGLGNIVATRRLSDGSIAVSAFIVDVQCLGVKNALFHVMSEHEYENNFKANMPNHHEENIKNVDPACAKKIITGAIAYAKKLGFSPHSDYYKSIGIFGDIDSNACPEKYEYGKGGKPFYMRGPNESIPQANKIVEKLEKKCGEGNYDYIIMV